MKGTPAATPNDRTRQFTRALDRPQMREVFQVILPRYTSHKIVVRRCKAKPIMSRKSLRARQIVISYFLHLEVDGAKAKEYELTGTLPVEKSMLTDTLGAVCRMARKHPLIWPFEEPSLYVPSLEMAVVFLPVDGVLPAMAEMTRNDCGRAIAPHIPECTNGTWIERVETELMHYKPANRSVIRMTAHLEGHDAGERNLYAKIYADDRSQNFREVRALWDAMGDCKHLKMPEPIGYDEDRKMFLMSEAPGDRSLGEWFKCVEKGKALPEGVTLERLDTCLQEIVGALAELHAIEVPLSRRLTFQDQLDRLDKDIELVEKHRPALAPLFTSTIDRLREHAPENEKLTPVHGGFRHKQTLGDDETGIYIIDWDGLVLANPAFDAATFTRQMRKSIPPKAEPRAQLQRIEEEFRRMFLEAHPRIDDRELAVYEALGLLELALRCFRRPSGLDDPDGLLKRFVLEANEIIDQRSGDNDDNGKETT